MPGWVNKPTVVALGISFSLGLSFLTLDTRGHFNSDIQLSGRKTVFGAEQTWVWPLLCFLLAVWPCLRDPLSLSLISSNGDGSAYFRSFV